MLQGPQRQFEHPAALVEGVEGVAVGAAPDFAEDEFTGQFEVDRHLEGGTVERAASQHDRQRVTAGMAHLLPLPHRRREHFDLLLALVLIDHHHGVDQAGKPERNTQGHVQQRLKRFAATEHGNWREKNGEKVDGSALRVSRVGPGQSPP